MYPFGRCFFFRFLPFTVIRDIYCRLVLGQTLQAGGQGAGQPQTALGPDNYEQAKTADRPLQGGGILTVSSPHPRRVVSVLLGWDATALAQWEGELKRKCAAKDQKDRLRDAFREAADRLRERPMGSGDGVTGVSAWDRALEAESLLHHHHRRGAAVIPDLPERLVTQSQVNKARAQQEQAARLTHGDEPQGLSAFRL